MDDCAKRPDGDPQDAIKDYLQSSDRRQALDCRESGVEGGFGISSAGNNDASSDEWPGSLLGLQPTTPGL